MTTKVEFQSGSGQAATGELGLPPGEGKAGALIVFPEWWGLNDHMRSIVDKFASAGFVTLCIDLYDGVTTKDAGEAQKLMGALDFGKALDRAQGAFEYLKAHPRSNGKVAATGFCLGGALTFAAATKIPDLAAAVPFYGIPDPSKVDYDAVKAPILAHFSSTDQWAKPELAAALRDKLNAAGKSMQLEVYDAEHAFVNDTRPEVYSPENAKLALDRTMAFLKKHLA